MRHRPQHGAPRSHSSRMVLSPSKAMGHQSPRSLKPQSGTTEALGAQQRVATPTRPLSQTTLLWTITSPMSTREAAAATTTQSRPEDGTSVGVQDVETPRHRFSRSPLAQTWKDAAGGDVESSRQLASATLASSITSSALAVPQKTVPCSTLLLTFARIQNPSVIQSRPQRSSGLLDSSTG